MSRDEYLLGVVFQELLLNQAMTKYELARTVKLSVYKINLVLKNHRMEHVVGEEQKSRVLRLYHRLKLYEAQIEEYLVKININR